MLIPQLNCIQLPNGFLKKYLFSKSGFSSSDYERHREELVLQLMEIEGLDDRRHHRLVNEKNLKDD